MSLDYCYAGRSLLDRSVQTGVPLSAGASDPWLELRMSGSRLRLVREWCGAQVERLPLCLRPVTFRSRDETLLRAASLAVGLISLTALSGHWLHRSILSSWVDGGRALSIEGSAVFIALAFGLWKLGEGQRSMVRTASLVAVLSLTFALAFGGVDVGGVFNPFGQSSAWMKQTILSVGTASGLLVGAIALVLFTLRLTCSWPMLASCAALLSIGLMGVLGHAVGLHASLSWARLSHMALPAAIAFVIIGAALLWYSPKRSRAAPDQVAPLLVHAMSVLVACGSLALAASTELQHSASWVERTLQIQLRMEAFAAASARMEAAAAGRGIDRRVPDQVRLHAGAALEHLRSLEELTAHSDERRARTFRMEALFRSYYAETLADCLAAATGTSRSGRLEQLSTKSDISAKLAAEYAALAEDEKRLLATRHGAASEVAQDARVVVVVGSLASIGLVAAAFAYVTRSKRALQSLHGELELRVWQRTAQLEATNLELEQTLERLARQEEDGRFLADVMPQLVWTTDQSGAVIYLNQRASQFSGVSSERLTETALDCIIHPDDRGPRHAQWRAAVESGLPYEMKMRLQASGGQYRWHLARAYPQRAPHGEIVRWVGTATDIHDHVLAEERARDFSKRIEAVLAHSPVILWALDRHGVFTVSEGRGLQNVGLKPHELIGRSYFDLFTPEISAPVRRALAGEQVAEIVSYAGRDFESHYTPVRDCEGTITGIVAVSADVTARKEAERLAIAARSATEASELKSQFLAAMSHEIRTPLNGVMGMATLLLTTPLSPEQRQLAEVIDRSASLLLSLVNDVLDFSKIEAGKLEIESTDFDFNVLLDDISRTFGHLAEQKQLSFSIEHSSCRRLLRGDPVRLRQIVSNFVANAIKFTSSGSVKLRVVCVSEDAAGIRLKIVVDDTGIGIPDDVRSRIFRPFSQADASMTRRFGGTGLGLSICKSLTELMGGEIGYESHVGRGSSFWVQLPFKWAVATAVNSSTVQIAQASGHLLVVEDNAVNRMVVTKMLDKLGYTYRLAENGQEALDRVAGEEFDAILMDCQMPVMDGIEAARQIRRSYPLESGQLPIIAMTANAMSGDKERCAAAGMNAYITKPFRMESLAVTLRSLLSVDDQAPMIRA